MKDNSTHIVAILDRSGSMQTIQADTIGGFNTFIEEQKRVPGEATLTLVQFNDTCETTYLDVPLAHVAHLTTETYKPSGWTALNDAFAKTIDEVGARLAAKPEHERPSKVVVLVMTDGAENKSVKFAGVEGRKKLATMISHQKDKYSWSFTFVGANIDAFATGALYSIDTTNIINYVSSPVGAANAFKSVSRGMAATRTAGTYGMSIDSFFENERNKETISDTKLDTLSIDDVIAKYTPAVTTTTTPAVIPPAVNITKTDTKSND